MDSFDMELLRSRLKNLDRGLKSIASRLEEDYDLDEMTIEEIRQKLGRGYLTAVELRKQIQELGITIEVIS